MITSWTLQLRYPGERQYNAMPTVGANDVPALQVRWPVPPSGRDDGPLPGRRCPELDEGSRNGDGFAIYVDDRFEPRERHDAVPRATAERAIHGDL